MGGAGQGSRVRRGSWGVGETNLGKRKKPQLHWWVSLWGSPGLGCCASLSRKCVGKARMGRTGSLRGGEGRGEASLLLSTSFLSFFNLRASFSRSCRFT